MKKLTMMGILGGTLVFSSLLGAPEPADSAASSATIKWVTGTVQTRSSADWRNAFSNQPVYPGMTVRTGGNSRAEIHYKDGSVTRVGARSLMRVHAGKDMNLIKGKTWINKKKDGQPMKIRTPIAVASVVGTELFVSHSSAQNTSHVTTLNGHVEVQSELGDKQMVNPGEWVEIEAGKPMEKPTKFDWNELKKNERFLLDPSFMPPDDETVEDEEDWK